MTVIPWPKHKLISAPPPNDSLGGCDICGSWEGEMPTDCPGRPMTVTERESVMAGRLDYIRPEGWTTVTRMQRLAVRAYCEGR